MRWVYFCQSGSGGPIKIGISTDPRRRMATLQTAHLLPLTLLGMIAGNDQEERRWHQKFQHLRLSGEWFHPDPELLKEIFERREIADAWHTEAER